MLEKHLIRKAILLFVVTLSVFSKACALDAGESASETAVNGQEQNANMSLQYKHKSEAEIAAMTPTQRVDEYADEQAFHKYDFLDEHDDLIHKYIVRDGLKIIPRVIEVMAEYDPTTDGRAAKKGERFDAMWMLLSDLDRSVVRLRGTAEGRQAMDAMERAIQRMRAAGHGRKDQHEWPEHGRFESVVEALQDAKGVNATDEAIKDTLWIKYKIKLSDRRLLAFSNFLVSRDPTYSKWSETYDFEDYSRVNSAGNPAQVFIMKSPERFYQAYMEFKKIKF